MVTAYIDPIVGSNHSLWNSGAVWATVRNAALANASFAPFDSEASNFGGAVNIHRNELTFGVIPLIYLGFGYSGAYLQIRATAPWTNPHGKKLVTLYDLTPRSGALSDYPDALSATELGRQIFTPPGPFPSNWIQIPDGGVFGGLLVPMQVPIEIYSIWDYDKDNIDPAGDTVRAYCQIQAVVNYTVATYTLTASSNSGGSISPSGVISVLSGSNQSFTMVPNANNYLADLLVDGVSVGHPYSYTFTNVLADHTIQAIFALQVNSSNPLSRTGE